MTTFPISLLGNPLAYSQSLKSLSDVSMGQSVPMYRLVCKIQCTSTLQVFWNDHRTSIYSVFFDKESLVFTGIYVICTADTMGYVCINWMQSYPSLRVSWAQILLIARLLVQLFYRYTVVLLELLSSEYFRTNICKN